jgi:hypothetical protein
MLGGTMTMALITHQFIAVIIKKFLQNYILKWRNICLANKALLLTFSLCWQANCLSLDFAKEFIISPELTTQISPEVLAVFNKIIKVQESYFAEVKKINQVATINIAVAKDDTTHEGHLETDTISLFIPNTANLNYFELYYLFAHEYLHSWFSPELFSLDKMPEAQIYWYTEGFTDFFTFVTLSMVAK